MQHSLSNCRLRINRAAAGTLLLARSAPFRFGSTICMRVIYLLFVVIKVFTVPFIILFCTTAVTAGLILMLLLFILFIFHTLAFFMMNNHL
jgi:hypothetical protein